MHLSEFPMSFQTIFPKGAAWLPRLLTATAVLGASSYVTRRMKRKT
jgi:hypothetical protein